MPSLTIDSTTGATFSIAGKLTTSAVSVHGGAATFSATVDGLDNLTLDGGDATFDASTDITHIDESGDSNLLGAGDLSVKQSYNWNDGTQGGDGTTTIEVGAQLVIDTSGGATLDRPMSLDGTGYWQGGDLTLNAKLDVGGTLDLQSSGALSGSGELAASGEITKTSSDDLTIEPKLTVDGIFAVDSGMVTLTGGGGGGGAIRLDSVTAGLTFDGGTYAFDDGSSLSGQTAFAGGGDGSPVDVKSGNVTFGGDYKDPSTTVEGGTVTFKGDVDSAKFDLSGGTANFSADTAQATIGELTQSDGTLGGTGKVQITDTYDWSGGTQANAGTTDLGSQASGTVSADVGLGDNRTLVNEGQLTLDGGSVALGNGTTVKDSGTIEIKGDEDFTGSDQATVTIDQAGTLKKSGGTSVGSIVDAKVENNGLVEAAQGSLQFGQDFTSDGGTVKIADGAEVQLNAGTATFGDNSTIEGTGSGAFVVNGANAKFNGTITAPTFEVADGSAEFVQGTISIDELKLSGTAAVAKLGTDVTVKSVTQSNGTLDGGSNLTVTDAYKWTGGTQQGYGTTTIPKTATLTLDDATTKTLNRTLDLSGSATWANGDVTIGYSGELKIESDAIFDITGDNTLTWPQNGIYQHGTFKKTHGSGTTNIVGPGFTNTTDSKLSVESGTLAFSGNLYNNGAVAVGPSSTLKTINGKYEQDDPSASTKLDASTSTLGTANGYPVVIQNGDLSGNGTIDAALTNSGTLEPGKDGPGKLHIVGDYNQLPDGTLTADVAGLTPGTQHDQLVVDGKAFLDGTLTTATADSFAPIGGQQFHLIAPGRGVGGHFGTEDTPAAGNSAEYEVAYGNDVTLTVKPPKVDIQNVTVEEGDGGQTPVDQPVTLSYPSSVPVTVSWQTADGASPLCSNCDAAQASDNDYESNSGTLTFPSGTTEQSIETQVNGDTKVEKDEQYTVNLTSASDGRLGKSDGVATVKNDDAPIHFDIVAKLGDLAGQAGGAGSTFDSLGGGPSINDHGSVAFQGDVTVPTGNGGTGAFIRDPSGPVRYLNPFFGLNPSRRFFEQVMLNNKDAVITQDRLSGSPPVGRVRVWDARPGHEGNVKLIAIGGGSGASSGGTINFNPACDPFSPLLSGGLAGSGVVIGSDCSPGWVPGGSVHAISVAGSTLYAALAIDGSPQPSATIRLDRKAYFDSQRPFSAVDPSGYADTIQCSGSHQSASVTLLDSCYLPYGPQGSSFRFAAGTTFTQQGTTAPPPNGGNYDAVVVPVINDQNVPLYLGLSGSDWYVVSPQGEAGPYQGFLRPWLTGDGHVALRAGGDDGNFGTPPPPPSPLVLWDDASFSDKATIACASGCANSGWSEIGAAPAASDNGQIVTWQGTLPTPPQNSGLLGGPGIYASIKTASGRTVVQIAGVGTKTDTNAKLGSFEEDATNPNVLPHRVAVTSTQASGDHSVTVVFMAWDDHHKQGMYTTRVHFMPSSSPGSTFDPNNPDHFGVDPPHKVVQIDDTISTIGKVTGIDYWDPINNHGTGDLAFWVSTDQTQAIVRTKVPDRRPVLFIPGVAGSTLLDSGGNEIWLDLLGLHERVHADPTDILDNVPNPKLTDRTNLSLQIDPACPNSSTTCNGFVTAPDVLQQKIQVGSNCCLSVYHEFLTRVINDGGYTPYSLTDTSGQTDLPGRKCNAQQDANGDWYQGSPGEKPNFFTFPYDWRRSNAQNAELVHNYIKDCIQKFWPDTRINILTHSMGSLLGRRYALQFGAHDDAVNSMITIAGPWLGAPKLDYVILTGGFVTGLPIPHIGIFDPGLHFNLIGRANGSDVKYVLQTMPAGHELAPSPAYQAIGGPAPLGERGRDLNGDGTSTQDYTFQQAAAALKALEPPVDPGCAECSFDPGATSVAFHSYGAGPQNNQDNWTQDTSGIKYFHLYGEQLHAKTIVQTFASGLINCSASLLTGGPHTCTPTELLDVHFGKGDGTVPTLSASRQGTQDLNWPGATVIPFVAQPSQDDGNFDHNGMLANRDLQDKVLQLLQQEDLPSLQPRVLRRLQHSRRSGAQLLRPATHAKPAHRHHKAKPAHHKKARKLTSTLNGSAQSIYLTVVGGDSINVADADGNVTQRVGGGDIAMIPSGVDVYPVGDHANTIVLDDKPGYTTTFNASGGGLTVIARIGAGDATSEVLRWSSIDVPAGATVALVSTQDGMSDLQYDSNGDGIVDTSVPPTLMLTGALANDVTPPSVNIGQTTVAGRVELAVTATDASGIQDVEYSLDGTHYQKYTVPFAVDPAQTPVVSAFATDAAGNTGTPAQYITAGLPANSAPAVHDVSVTGVIDTPLPIALGAVDLENDPLTYTVVTAPAHGTLGTVDASGSVVYTPTHSYLGPDSFTYTVSDGIHTTLPVTVSITIGSDTAPVAQDASAGVRPGTPRTLTLPATDVDGTPLTYSIVSQPASGTLGTINGAKVTYTPSAGYTGPDSFTFKASDGVLDSNVATVSLTVIGDRAPVAVGASVHAKPGLPLNLTLGATDADADLLTFAPVSRPVHGTLTIGVDGAATYTSDAGYSGPDSFTWKANDGELDSNIAAVSIDVQPNRAPVASDATSGVKIDEPRTLHLQATDADHDPLTYTVVAGPTHGTLGTIAPNGTVVYTPNAGYSGSDSFNWKVNDGIVDSNTATQAITVAANAPPVAADVSFGLAADRTKMVTLSATDADGDPLTYSVVTGPAHGTLGAVNGNKVLYTPNATFTGTESFTYKANDGAADSNIATVHVTVTAPANNAPTLAADTITTPEDTAAIVDLTANDSDLDGDSIHVVSLSNPAHGAAILQPDGTVKYQPLPNYNGPDSFSYRACDNGVTNGTPDPRCSSGAVTVVVTPVNDAPSANLDAVSLAEGSTQLFDAVANDTPGPSDEIGQHLALSALSPAQHGAATLENGQIRYTPAPSYNGPDNFTYTVCDDGTTNGLLDPLCSTGTVQVTVWEVNDPPVPQPDNATLAEDSSTLVNVLRNDANGPANESDQHLSVQSVGAPAHGAASVDPLTGQVLYQPAPDYNGPDSFAYTACDDGTTHGAPDPKCATGTVTVTVWAVNDPPAAANDAVTTLEDTQLTLDPRGNDTPGPANEADQHLNLTTLQQPQHGTASILGGLAVYTPAADYNGPDSFTYSVCDDGTTNGNPDPQCATATVNVTVAPVNDPPVPAPDSASLAEDSTLLVDVVANDSPGPPDEATQSLTLQSVGTPAHGTASVSHGKLLYIPSRDSNGPDSVTYTVCDNGTTNGLPDPMCATGTLNLSVTEANDPPQATNDELSVPVGGAGTVDVLANDVAGPANESSQTLTIQSLGTPTGGTATVQNGMIVYTAAAGFTGTDSLTYTVCDNGTTAGQSDPKCDNATVDIGVGVPAFNHTPQAHNGSFAMTEDAPPIQIDLGQLVSDRETAVGNLTYTIVSQPVRGTVSVNGETATYGSNPYARGTDTFTYKASDGGYPDGCGEP